MRICVLIDAWEPIWGGGQTHVHELTQKLAATYSYEFDIFTRALIEGVIRYSNSEIGRKRCIRLFRIGPVTQFFDWYGRLTWFVTVTASVWKKHRQKPYALIHAHAFSAGIPGKILSWLLRLPLIFTVHGSHNLDLGKRTPTALLEKLILTKIPYDKVISVSSSFLNYPNINSDIEVIPNGVNIELFDTVEKIQKRSAKFKVLWVGRFDKYKGLDILVQAFATFSKLEKNTILKLVGDGPEKRKIESLIRDLGLEKKVQLIPRCTGRELVRHYKSSDIFVLPSVAEGQPIVLLEAWAARLPVIASDVGDNRRFVKNGVNGCLIAPRSVPELIDALVNAKRNPNLAQLGEAGYRMVKSRFTWDIIAKNYHQIYQKFLKK